ncbi:hypothetical protein CYG49_04610, partial [Candidatus Saccharibacteria bacterium]
VEHLSRRFSIILVTARDPKWESATRLWLRDNFGPHCTNLHFAGRKHDGSSKTKGELCAEVGADYLLDDNLDHCHSAAKEGVATVLFGSYGWHENVPEEQIVCKDWTAVREFFDEQRSDQL